MESFHLPLGPRSIEITQHRWEYLEIYYKYKAVLGGSSCYNGNTTAGDVLKYSVLNDYMFILPTANYKNACSKCWNLGVKCSDL